MTAPFLAVFKKELIDTLRDRRTLVAMILVPALLTPALMIGVSKYTQSHAAEAQGKTLRVAVAESDSKLADHLRTAPGVEVELTRDVSRLPARILAEELDAAVVVDPTFTADLARNRPGGVTLIYYSGNDLDIEKKRVKTSLEAYGQQILDQRLHGLGLDPSVVRGIDIQEKDVASDRERFGKLIGGLLPYMFILFCFSGSMYPAIDLAAGEKERGTLETLLTAPVHRRVFVLGKFAIVTLTGIISAVIAMLGLWVTVTQGLEGIPGEAVSAIGQLFDPASIAVVLALLLPLSMFFAAALLMLSVYARSYKEAMSIISPLMIVILIPAMATLLPGTRLTPVTAAIPVLNVSLASRELLSGTAEPALVALVFASLVALAGLSLYACTRWFAREDIVFRA